MQAKPRAIGFLKGKTPKLRPQHLYHSQSDAAQTNPHEIAIIGAGITGLASAFYLTLSRPRSRITIYQASTQLGGWVSSKYLDVGNGKSVLFEQGPRSLRPNFPSGYMTLELAKLLNIDSELIFVPNTTSAAQNRFIYFPDHLVRMPSAGLSLFQNINNLLFEPLFKGVIQDLIFERFKQPKLYQDSSINHDESVGSFLSRRYSRSTVNNIVSAVFHGIYAGDVWQLSVKSILPRLWALERDYSNVTDGQIHMWLKHAQQLDSLIMSKREALYTHLITTSPHFGQIKGWAKGMSIFSFKKGLSQLTNALADRLGDSGRVVFKTSCSVQAVEYDDQASGVRVLTDLNQPPITYNRVISTIPSNSFSELLNRDGDPTCWLQHSVTVMVVNFYYKTPDLIPVQGFGYLIPQSIPFLQNPERALGVVFDSDTIPGQDGAGGTKVTVMLGGHWWDSWDIYPDQDEAVKMAKSVLKRHLGIALEPDVSLASLQKDCIPQYRCGHEANMRSAHQDLLHRFRGHLSVAGSSYTGVGINDCIRAARELSFELGDVGSKITGLESFVNDDRHIFQSYPLKSLMQPDFR
ncbi:MAG: oxygen-dependent protoporphyrinogen oxidase [Trizodia sp. TS-e1964]|nr:MAG: oxygen-dependent protoporphyrinogen oxidase [Trizodia sp. TS-e1964]